jgi:hypothetical protein
VQTEGNTIETGNMGDFFIIDMIEQNPVRGNVIGGDKI